MSTVVLDDVTREGIRNILRASVISITFTKSDGSSRIMKCTLNEEFLPKVDKDTNSEGRKVNPDVCPVWDMENQAWRSFRWDSITKIEV
jgi:hypothetical protein